MAAAVRKPAFCLESKSAVGMIILAFADPADLGERPLYQKLKRISAFHAEERLGQLRRLESILRQIRC